MHHRPALSAAIVLTLLALAPGCASQFPKSNDNLEPASAEFDVPPKELIEKIRAALSTGSDAIGITEQAKGTLLTGFERHPGEWHVGRRWQEQTRYRITIIPDFEQPTARSRVEVREQTQQRAAEGMKWEPLESDRQDRAQALLDRIRQQLQ